MEQEIQNYLAKDQQYLDRIASALSQVKEKGNTMRSVGSAHRWGSGKKSKHSGSFAGTSPLYGQH